MLLSRGLRKASKQSVPGIWAMSAQRHPRRERYGARHPFFVIARGAARAPPPPNMRSGLNGSHDGPRRLCRVCPGRYGSSRLEAKRQRQAIKTMVSSADAVPEAIRRELLPTGSAVVAPPAAVATEPNH